MFFYGFGVGFGAFLLAVGLYFRFIHKPPTVEPDQACLLKNAHLEREVQRLEGELSKVRETQKADDGLEQSVLKAQLAAKEYMIEDSFAALQATQAQVRRLEGIVQELEEENAGLRAAIENGLKIPGYAAFIRKRERPVVACRLWAEGWSKRQIMKHVWGYIGSSSSEQLAKALSQAG